ncbi:transposable element Tcb2 transposase [Trichonephila clavipes]|nr:transposable element Tcb2 transposase [Trichonephila clavipes]
MTRKRAKNREGSLGFPGFVKPVFIKESKPFGNLLMDGQSNHLVSSINTVLRQTARALPLTPEHRQQWCQARSMWNAGLFWRQMIMVWGSTDCPVIACDSRFTLIVMHGTLTVQRYVDDILLTHTLPWPTSSPDLSLLEHVWDQLKRQMPSCHSVHDLELAVQDLWAHLPQENIRCLINSVPDRVVACIATGGGPTLY